MRNKYEIIIKMTSSSAYFAQGLVWKLEEVRELQAQTLINALKCLRELLVYIWDVEWELQTLWTA